MTDNNAIKVILIGETGDGKTNLIRVALGKEFESNSCSTLTSSFYDCKINVNNKNYLYHLWDTNGHETFRSINKIFINQSKIVLIVFSMNNRHSFGEVDYWYNYTKAILGEDGYIIALVGNKSDLFEWEEFLSNEEVEKKAKELNVKYIITSALKDAEGFRKFLDELLEEYINKYHPEEYKDPKTIKIGKEKKNDNNKSKNKCKN